MGWRVMLFVMMLGVSLPCAAGRASGPAGAGGAGLHGEIIDAYMDCQWDVLGKLLKEKASQIAALPGEQAADVMAIRAAMAECRPSWWERVKTGGKVSFRVSMWGRGFGVTQDPACVSNMQISVTNDVPTLTVKLPAADMDSVAPSEHGFTKGDQADLAVFATLGGVESWSLLPPGEAPLNEAGKMGLARFLDFRGNLAGIAYTNPRGRRWGMWVFLAAYEDKFVKLSTRMGREALGALLVCEVLEHPGVYKSFSLPGKLAGENAESVLARSLMPVFEKKGWSLAEDNAFRLAVKQLANATGTKTFTTGLVELPSKLNLSLDPQADKALQVQRDAWVKRTYDKLMASGKTGGVGGGGGRTGP